MSLGTLLMDVSDEPIFTMDWSPRLATGETIATSTWVVALGLTNLADSIVVGALKTNIKLSAVLAGTYSCTNTVTTSLGQTLERTGYVEVREL